MDKKSVLRDMFLRYWQWDVEPELDNPPKNSPEYFVLSMYDDEKQAALCRYPWRSAVRYAQLELSKPERPADGRYRYEADLPEDFGLAVGFWQDSQRRMDCHNAVDIVGKKARTNLNTITLGYIKKDVEEDELDPWVIDYLEIFIASDLSDIGGQSPDRKNYLNQKAETDLIACGNKDYEMSQKDEVSSTTHQFEWY